MKSKLPPWLNRHWKSREQKFAEVRVLIDLVISMRAPALLITGTPGTGKTRVVRERLMKAMLLEGFQYRIVKGHGSALGLYSLLYECRNQILILDDADALFQDPRSVNLLKAALDSDTQARKISWQSQSAAQMDVPMEFEFKGAVIFISNIRESQMDPAVLSRSLHYNLELSSEEILASMYNLLDVIEVETPVAAKHEVLQMLVADRKQLEAGGKFNLRTLVNGIRIRSSGTPLWKELLKKCA
jgi:hypothetical protein